MSNSFVLFHSFNGYLETLRDDGNNDFCGDDDDDDETTYKTE